MWNGYIPRKIQLTKEEKTVIFLWTLKKLQIKILPQRKYQARWFKRRLKSNFQGSENFSLTENKQEGLLPNLFYDTSKTTEQDQIKTVQKGKRWRPVSANTDTSVLCYIKHVQTKTISGHNEKDNISCWWAYRSNAALVQY